MSWLHTRAPRTGGRNILWITCAKRLLVPVKPRSPRDWESTIH